MFFFIISLQLDKSLQINKIKSHLAVNCCFYFCFNYTNYFVNYVSMFLLKGNQNKQNIPSTNFMLVPTIRKCIHTRCQSRVTGFVNALLLVGLLLAQQPLQTGGQSTTSNILSLLNKTGEIFLWHSFNRVYILFY